MWNNKTVSVVMATYREKESVKRVAREFLDLDAVDEMIIVNNNAETGTDEELAGINSPKLVVLHERRQGYGYALETGLLAAKSDYIVTAEPDGTYTARDLKRFLVMAEDFKVVLGSRAMVRTKNKDWGIFRRHANIVQGMMISLLFHTNTITDVGCLYRLFHNEVIQDLKNKWNTRRLFATDVLVLIVKDRFSFAEIPVTFEERSGDSTMLGNGLILFKYGWEGLVFIFEKWIPWFCWKIFRRIKNV